MAFSFWGIARLLIPLSLATAAKAADIVGVWTTDDGDGVVEIQPCGQARCGRIIGLKEPLDQRGQPTRDVNNPDITARNRPLCGAEIIHGAAHQSDGRWDGGSIYDPQEGKSYKVMLKADSEKRLVAGLDADGVQPL